MASLRCSSMFCIMGALQLLWVLSLLPGSYAQTTACLTTLLPLEPCVGYLTAGNTTSPGSACCTPLVTILNSSDPSCICQLPTLAKTLSFVLNQTRALEVAFLCHQTVPESVESCLSASSPSISPSSSPSSGGTNGSNHGPNLLVLVGSIFGALLVHLSMST